MPKTYEGNLVAEKLRFGLVCSRWNSFITEKMLEGALDTLKRHGATDDNLEVARVPGTWEIPVAVQAMAASKRFDALIAVGCLIRGATPHFDYLAGEVTKGLGKIGLDHNLPVTYGVITVENLEQAIERAGTKAGNKGSEAAQAAIEMANLMAALKG